MWIMGVETIKRQTGWLANHRSVCGHTLSLQPIGCTCTPSVTQKALLQLQYAACGAIQVFMPLLPKLHDHGSSEFHRVPVYLPAYQIILLVDRHERMCYDLNTALHWVRIEPGTY